MTIYNINDQRPGSARANVPLGISDLPTIGAWRAITARADSEYYAAFYYHGADDPSIVTALRRKAECALGALQRQAERRIAAQQSVRGV